MTHPFRGVVTGASAALMALAPTPAEGQIRHGAVGGRLTSGTSSNPVSGAVIEIEGQGLHVISDSAGVYRLSRVVPGEVSVVLRAIGFQPMQALVVIRPGSLSRLNFVLRSVAALPTVEVEEEGLRRGDERMRGFHTRRESGFGRFITRSDIERRNVSDAKELLRGLPGVRLVGSRIQMAAAQSTPLCMVQFFVDAIHITGPPGDFLSQFRPGDIEGIEVYRGPAETPADFSRGGASCGTIVIWTRTPGGPR